MYEMRSLILQKTIAFPAGSFDSDKTKSTVTSNF